MTHDSVAPGGSVDRRRYDRVRVVDPRAARSARRQALSGSAWRRGQSDTWPEKTRKVSGFAKCEMRNVQFREMRNAKFRAISQGQIDVPKWNRAAGGAKLPGEVRSSVDAPSTPWLPTTSGHASSWQQRAEAAAKQEQQDFLAAFSKVDAAAMAKKPSVCEACKGCKQR
jgi:hypothetical protein